MAEFSFATVGSLFSDSLLGSVIPARKLGSSYKDVFHRGGSLPCRLNPGIPTGMTQLINYAITHATIHITKKPAFKRAFKFSSPSNYRVGID